MNQFTTATSESNVAATDRGGRLRGPRTARAAMVALLVSQAVLLVAIVWVLRGGEFGPASAAADDRVADAGVANVGPRQRKSMLESLAAIEKRLGDIDARLADGVLRVEIADADAHR